MKCSLFSRGLLAASTLGLAACGGVDAPPGHNGPPSEMISVAGGEFQMGCKDDSNCESDELPYHAVTLDPFEIDRLEITQTEFKVCIEEGACSEPAGDFEPEERGDHPVTTVTFGQASDYCAWVGKRLPTEAEWEKAARGTDARTYPWGDEAPSCTLANGPGCGNRTTAVGTHPNGASMYGVEDMAGNVFEWVSDWYAWHYYDESPDENPPGPEQDPPGPEKNWGRTVRGGSFGDFASLDLRVANRAPRSPENPEDGYENQVGFRCARSK